MKRTIALAALSGLLLVTAACGSDDSSSSATEATTAEAEAGASETTDIATDATDAPTSATEAAGDVTIPDVSLPDVSFPDVSMPDMSDLTIPDLSDITLPAGLPPECMAYATAFMGAFGALDGSGDVDADAIDQAFSDLKGMVPEDLRDDVDVMAGAMSDVLAVLAEYDYDFTKVMSDPEAAAKLDAMNTDEVQTAQTNLEDYLEGICGDQLNG